MNPNAPPFYFRQQSAATPERTRPALPMQLFNRRACNTTDRTIDSITPSFREELHFNNYTSRILTANASAEDTLKAFLSSDSIVSTPSLSDRRHNDTQPDIDPQLFNEINNGSYGAIFERPGTLEIVKRPINTRDPPENPYNLWNDFKMHTLIYESFLAVKYENVHIPRPLQFISANDNEWWSIWRTKWETQYQVPTNLLFAERVLPVPRAVRDAIADHFCPPKFTQATKASSKNRNCLIHPLLGRRKGTVTPRGMLNLRNFELCIDQMESLGINITNLIDSTASSLAILHFAARVDAHDIEFVLGTAPPATHNPPIPFRELDTLAPNSTVMPSSAGPGINFHGRAVHLWMLDLNRVARIPDRESFVRMALRGFVDQSKAYYPRPRSGGDHSDDGGYWVRFKTAYLRRAEEMVGEGWERGLAAAFIEAVEEHYAVGRMVGSR